VCILLSLGITETGLSGMIGKVTGVQKVKIARIASSSYFWMATIVFFLQSKGLSLTQVLTLISVYTITNAVCEYPTGVIADYFSQKISLLAGNILVALGMLGVLVSGGFVYYAFVMVIIGIGRAFESGSDTAVFHEVSSDFEKDLKQNNSIRIIWLAFSISAGSFIAKYVPEGPYYLSAVASIVAFLFTLTVNVRKEPNESSNIFMKANEGLTYVWSNKNLMYLLLYGGVMSAFFASIKWFYNPYFESIHIDIRFWGILITILTLINALGVRYYTSKINSYISLVALIVTLALSGLVELPIISVISMFSVHIMKGFIDTQNDIAMNKQLISSIRASVLSLKSLLSMLGSSLYLFLAGYLINVTSLPELFLLTATGIGILGSVCITLSYRHRSMINPQTLQ
jgi:MFS family permease